MENILIGTAIATLTGETIADLTAGEIGLLLHSTAGSVPLLRGTEVTNAELANARAIQFICKRSDGGLDASLIFGDKEITNKNYQGYSSGVAGIYKLGDNASAETALSIPTTGEGTIRLVDLVNPSNLDNFPAIITCVKLASESVLQYLTKVVTKINADPIAKTLVNATLETASSRYQIKLTTLNSDIKLGIATADIFEGLIPITVTTRTISKGSGAEIQRLEKELSVFKGNGNYVQDNDLYWKESLKASTSTSYNVLSITGRKVTQTSNSGFVNNPAINVLVCTAAGDTTLEALYGKFSGPLELEE